MTQHSSDNKTYPDSLRINADRLWSRHVEMAKIGAIDGTGNCRLAMTAEDAAARDLYRSWCDQAGLETRIDKAGNMFAFRSGSDSTRPAVAAGSHLDTQPHGGRFDGISGVLTALEVIETLNDAGISTEAPIAAINWTNEEGVRFAPGLMGSSWFTGKLTDKQLFETLSNDGLSFEQEAQARGYLGAANPDEIELGAFFELHIEQGPILERNGQSVGVVTSVQGLRWLDVRISGMDAHAGTTPMDARKDTILVGAHMLVGLNALGRSYATDARVSVGAFRPQTDGASTIAGRTDFVIDIRHPDAEKLQQLSEECARLCESTAKDLSCRATVVERIYVPPVQFDPDCVERVRHAAQRLGCLSMNITSGALHDACNLARITPSAMIFIPCKDGISHNVLEDVNPRDLEAGCNVLLHAVLSSASPLSQR